MNQVQKIALNFSGEDELFFRSLYADWNQYWTTRLEKSTDRILEKYNNKLYTIEIEALDLQLGSMNQSDFNHYFLSKYEEALEDALLKHLHGNETLRTKKTETHQNRAELLFHFLLHGSFPWNTGTGIKSIDLLFLEVAEKDGKSLRSFFRTYGHYTSLQQRLVLQFNEKTLKIGVKIAAPGERHFILSYVELIQTRYQQLRAQQINPTQYHQTIWQVVYAYLLTNRSSFFNKKSFLEQTIRQLANRYLISYSELLQLLLLNNKKDSNYSVELLTLLTTLKKEEELNIRGKNDWKTWIQFMVTTEQDLLIRLKEEKNTLIQLLRKENNYLFLQLFQEPQLLKLVEITAPQQSSFVKVYIKELEQQKNQGMLQGKAGSEFRLVKWQILFPVLLDNSGSGFNRHYFVERVLQKVAAHYNLKMIELLRYLQKETSISRMDKELSTIFRELYLRFQVNAETSESIDSVRAITASAILRQLQSKKDISEEETEKWLAFLKNEPNRNVFLQQLSENEHRRLIRILYQQESRFILAYAVAISQQKNKGALQGKTSGNFKTLKWQFIHSVILEPQHQVFNKRYFIEKVIRKIAAHYNLKTEELTAFLYAETAKNGLEVPFELIKILTEIHQEQKQKQLKKEQSASEKTTEELPEMTSTEQFLIRHFGKEEHLYFLIRRLAQKTDFIRFIEPVLHIESALRQFMSSRLAISIDKKQLVLLLLRISMSHTHLNKADMLQKILVFFFSQLKEKEQQQLFSEQLEKTAETNPLLKKSMELDTEQEETIIVGKEQEEELIPEDEQQPLSFIGNAGLILLAPFLPRLLTLLKLTENGTFKDRDAQIKAIFLMQYAAFGTTEFPEYELQLNKLLAGFKTGIPMPRSIALTEHEMETTDGMLQGVVQHWNKVKTIEGLREGFLQREGKLDEKDETIELTVENKAYDMLLDAIPWNFKTTKFSWMEKTIQVKWR